MARRLTDASREWLRRALDDSLSVDFFTAEFTEIDCGEEVRLSWSVSNAEVVTIEPDVGNVPPEGSMVVRPLYTTRFTLTALNDADIARSRLRINVLPVRLMAPLRLVYERPQLTSERPRLVDMPRAAALPSPRLDWLRRLLGL